METETSIVFNIGFGSKTISSCFFFFILIIDLYFLIPAVITEMFFVNAELVVPTGITNKEARAEIETHLVTVESKISKCSVYFRILQTFLCFLFIYSFCFFSLMK